MAQLVREIGEAPEDRNGQDVEVWQIGDLD